VLRLWPEAIYIGLFPGHCWLQRGAKGEMQFVPSPMEQNGDALLGQLQRMLDNLTPALTKGAQMRVVVSDAIASIITLPWQEQISRPIEIASYAKVCFGKQGIVVDEDSLLHAEFRHFGGKGVAYALPCKWVQSLQDMLGAKQARLKTVLPLSAVVYFRQGLSKKTMLNLSLLQESGHISALIWGGNGLAGHDVEVIARSPEAAQHRLLQRVAATYGKIDQIDSWRIGPDNKSMDTQALAKQFGEIKIDSLKKTVWMS
jgi:hypothetical protein